MSDTVTGMLSNANGVLHQIDPPTTGSQKCDMCGGWIVGVLSYVDEGKRYCPTCWAAHKAELEKEA